MGKKEKENDEPPPLNLNIGVMGHVDSGKTSLVKALSTTLSTASLDRAPQSQARGITLDLGFSSFRAPLPEHLEGDGDLQFTLVDCPGHASLIRTIIGGAQIIDAMVLVVDIIKGVQPQTAECLVIGEITTHDLIIALNKVDQISEEERPAAIEAATKKLRRQLSSSKFKDAPVVACAACVGGEKVAAVGRSELKSESIGLDELVATLRKRARVPKRDIEGPFFFAIDHCFPIRGQGTVVTGTALRGQCKVGDSVELPALGMELCGNQISAAPRHRRDVASVAASARWREGSTPSTRRCPRNLTHWLISTQVWRKKSSPCRCSGGRRRPYDAAIGQACVWRSSTPRRSNVGWWPHPGPCLV